jgi:hypothetical protein
MYILSPKLLFEHMSLTSGQVSQREYLKTGLIVFKIICEFEVLSHRRLTLFYDIIIHFINCQQ